MWRAIAQLPEALQRVVPEVLASDSAELTQFCRGLLAEMLEQLRGVEAHIADADQKAQAFMRR